MDDLEKSGKQDNVYQMFNKLEKKAEERTVEEHFRHFLSVMDQSVDTYHTLSVMDKYALHIATVGFLHTFIEDYLKLTGEKI